MKKLLVLSAIAVSVFAADYQVGVGFGRNSVAESPMKNYNFGNIRIGKYLPNNNILRIEGERSINNEIGNTEKTSLKRAILNIEHDFNIDSKLTPYVFAGAGYQWIGGGYHNGKLIDLGIGAKYYITKTVSLFAEARGLRDYNNLDNHYGFIGGLVFNFGGETAAPAPKTEPVKVIDSDNDGVPDSMDKCPNTPAGVKVDKNGCPIDSDKDGVPDYLDKCPNTPKGMKVDKNGCAISFNFDITFDTNSAKIKPEFMPQIEKFAEFLKSYPDIKAEIQGYTDSTGKYEYNMVLSQKRAKAVYNALIKLGVNKDQITWAGYGPQNPIAPNTTKEGRAKNRRVVAKIIY